MYCLTCKKQTSNIEETTKTTPSGRNIMTAKCGECGRTKSKFISASGKHQKGGSLLNIALKEGSKFMPEMHLPINLYKPWKRAKFCG